MKNKVIIYTSVGILSIALIFILTLTGRTNTFLKKYDLDHLSFKELVEHLDEQLIEPSGFGAAITGNKLILSDPDDRVEINVPKNLFYLSLAPYINSTHPCANHNLVTCRAELTNATIEILVVDQSGRKIVNDTFTTYDNGFIGIWLPRNIEGTITVSYNGRTATEAISTYDNSNTCLTTLKLT